MYEICLLYLLELLFVFLSMALPHVPLLGLGVAEGDEALEALKAVMLICKTEEKRRFTTRVNAANSCLRLNMGETVFRVRLECTKMRFTVLRQYDKI